MSDDQGNINGELVDSPSPNAAVVGVDVESGAGNEITGELPTTPPPSKPVEPPPEPESEPEDE